MWSSSQCKAAIVPAGDGDEQTLLPRIGVSRLVSSLSGLVGFEVDQLRGTRS